MQCNKRITKNKKQWNILIGSWLFYYLSACYNKYQKLQQIFKIHKNLKVYIEKPDQKICTFSTEDFLKNINLNDFWNAEIYFQLLTEMKKKIILSKIKKKKILKNLVLGNETSLKRKIISSILNYFFIKLSKNHSFIIQTYLSIFDEIQLNFKINGVPLFFTPVRINFKKSRDTKLHKLNNLLVKQKKEIFFNFINKNLISDVPEIFIKYFSNIYKKSLNLKWPSKPNTIFTSNLFETDELFKMYVAINNKKYNSNYIIGQHGNSYNIAIQTEYNPETNFSDKFLSWSSVQNSKINFLSLGNFVNKNYDQRKKTFQFKNILIVLRSRGLDYEIFDRPNMNRQYNSYLLSFLKNLSPMVRDKIIIKPHFTHFNDNFLSKIKITYKELKILDINTTIDKYYEDYSTLIIFNYDSSGMYKTFHINKPTICFWPNEFNHIRNNALNYYREMKRIGIFYENPKKLSQSLNNLVKNNKISKWWFSKQNQSFIYRFNNKYNKKIHKNNKLSKLKNILFENNYK